MDSARFQSELDKALALCRSAAKLELPIEAMLEEVGAAQERAEEEGLMGEAGCADLEALHEILSAVGDVAAIGSKLPAAEAEAAALDCPLPANLRRAR